MTPIQNKDVSTIKDYAYYESDDQVDTIIYFKKQVGPSRDSRVDTNIIDRIRKLSVRPILFEPAVTGQDLVTSVRQTLCDGLSPKSLNVKDVITDKKCKSTQVDRIAVQNPGRDIHNQPGVNVDAVVATPVSPNSRGTSRHLKIPLIDLKPKK